MSGIGIKDLSSLDRVIHEPARLMIMTILYAVEEAHYLTISKTFKGKYPLTLCRLTKRGREAFEAYSATLRCVTEGLASRKP